MKTTKRVTAILISALLTLVIYGWHPSEIQPDIAAKQSVIVLLKFKAQQDKGVHAVSELNNLLEKVKEEPNFISIRLHVDPNDNTNILLYEEWEDKSYYNTEHMNTSHLKEFMTNSADFLTGPPEITFWEVKNVFK